MSRRRTEEQVKLAFRIPGSSKPLAACYGKGKEGLDGKEKGRNGRGKGKGKEKEGKGKGREGEGQEPGWPAHFSFALAAYERPTDVVGSGDFEIKR